MLSLRDRAARARAVGDYCALLLTSVTGMVVLAGASNLVTLFLGLELLSIPLYVMCALDLRRRTSLESGLKYLVIGSVGSATLLYGLAMIYGATGTTDFGPIAAAIESQGILGDPLLLTGIALAAAGLAFKASVAPFHQWTPDVYQGAPTPVTAFMAVATKAAAFAIILRFFDVALLPAVDDWDAALAALAVASIVVGNVGRDRAGLAQAPAGLVGRRAGRLHPRRRRRGERAGRQERRLLPVRLPGDEHGGVRGGDRARARDARSATASTRSTGSARRGRRWPGR